MEWLSLAIVPHFYERMKQEAVIDYLVCLVDVKSG